MLATLDRNFPADQGASASTWQELAESDGGVPRRSFFRAKKKLTEGGYVENTGLRGACRITDAGRTLLKKSVPSAKSVPNGAMAPSRPQDGGLVPSVPHPFRGGTDGTNRDGQPAPTDGEHDDSEQVP